MNNYHIKSAAAMMELGATLAKTCGDSAIIYLIGELGAGKTTLVQGFINALGYQGAVTSPTFTLVESYNVYDKQIYHFDLYRLNYPQELEDIGIRDYFATPAIWLIEWPERGKGVLPPADIICTIKITNNFRKVSIEGTYVT